MRQQQMRARVIVLAALTLAIQTGCSRRHDDQSITAAPERAAAPVSVDSTSPPVAAPAEGVARNPLAMPLKHDRPNVPGQPNPLCMRLK